MLSPQSVLQVHHKASPEVITAAYRALVKLHAGNDEALKKLNIAKNRIFDKKEDLKSVGNFKIVKKIAEGGFGITYYGEHLITKAPVCIKHAINVSPEDEELLLEEANIIWDLRHHGIPAVRDVVRLDDGSICLIMSYIPGPTLEQLVEYNIRIDPESVSWIAERLINVLKYLHWNGVVHGDIKPQNIIIQPKSHTLSIVDYGLSKVKPNANSKTKGYTPIFAAPEQIRDEPLLPETDFYCLGLTMIYALGGDVEKKQVPTTTPKNMCEFIQSLIVHNPLNRPNWHKKEMMFAIQNVRELDFGRKFSNMKAIPWKE